jgi:very-short-patch-repair endonuclease
MRSHGGDPPLEAALLTLAARQHNLVEHTQLAGLGFTKRQIGLRVGRGWLRPVYRGVYSVGRTALTRDGVWMAGALALGSEVGISHQSAVELWTMMPGCSSPIHLTSPTSRKPRRGLAIHCSPLAGELTVKRGVPVTKPERTLIDYAETIDRRTLERAADEAIRQRLTAEAKLRQAIDRHPGRSGAAKLRALLGDHAAGSTATDNDFEELLIGICDDFGVLRPVCQYEIGPYRVDFAWPEQRLVVEADSWETHGTREAFEADRVRDAELDDMGWPVRRFTWRQLTRRRAWVAAKIDRALDRDRRAAHG